MKVRITTNCDKYLKRRAEDAEIKYTDALELGIKAMLNINTDKEEIIREIHRKKAEIIALNEKMKELEELEAKAKKEKAQNVVKRFDY